MATTRRGFLGLLAAAIAASAVDGHAFTPAPQLGAPPELKPKRLRARHWCQYDLPTDQFHHRIDVMLFSSTGVAETQYGVDFMSATKRPQAHEIESGISVLTDHIEAKHGDRYELDVRSFDLGDNSQYHAGMNWLGRIGETLPRPASLDRFHVEP